MKNLQHFTHEGINCLEFNSERPGNEEEQIFRAMVLSVEKMPGWGDMAPQTIHFALIDTAGEIATKHSISNGDGYGVDYMLTADNIMEAYDKGNSLGGLTGQEEMTINKIFDGRQEKINKIKDNFKAYSTLEPAQRVGEMFNLLTELGGPLTDYKKLMVKGIMERACNKVPTPSREVQIWNNIARHIDPAPSEEQPAPTEPAMEHSEPLTPSRSNR
jgi:hypothetical protein